MASTAASSFSIIAQARKCKIIESRRGRVRRTKGCVQAASQESEGGSSPPFGRKKGTPGFDTRIHWENPDEGWLGVKPRPEKAEQSEEKNENFGEKFADLLKNSTDSHYQFLGVSAEADLEEIKAAYRRLSKEYHPDTTSLPIKVASDKFMQLREVYDVLSDEERRKFYDWTLAQEAASMEAERMRLKLEDPYEQEVRNWESVPDMVDRLGGSNLELSDQAMTALTFDAVVIIFSICTIIYVAFFKEPS
ncbi:NAD(P)H-quinone oxidoreductase subunit T, chloroplastic [Aristolochia californica]|uniref:NAD(P)H-quinone oxidoreductase subunit T, chloroplastic n=1 Tax=Aristolochia californica TaxID=171875 RepID=UPI0035E0E064